MLVLQSERRITADGGADGEDGVCDRRAAQPAAQADGEVSQHQAPAADAETHRVRSGEDADQLDGSLYVQISQGLCRLLAVPAV